MSYIHLDGSSCFTHYDTLSWTCLKGLRKTAKELQDNCGWIFKCILLNVNQMCYCWMRGNLGETCAKYEVIHIAYLFQEWWFTNNHIKHHDVCLSLSEQKIGAPLLMRFCDNSENQVLITSVVCVQVLSV